MYWEIHNPTWRTPSLFRGVGINHQRENSDDWRVNCSRPGPKTSPGCWYLESHGSYPSRCWLAIHFTYIYIYLWGSNSLMCIYIYIYGINDSSTKKWRFPFRHGGTFSHQIIHSVGFFSSWSPSCWDTL